MTLDDFTVSSDYVSLRTAGPLKTMSSAVHNAGTGWYRAFVNRHVDANYDSDDVKAEMAAYLEQHGFHGTDTVGMMTAVTTEHAEVEAIQGDFGTVLIAVTAGVGNAVDVSQALHRDRAQRIGTINTWIIVNATLPDEAFIQAMITATEAKTKALASGIYTRSTDGYHCYGDVNGQPTCCRNTTRRIPALCRPDYTTWQIDWPWRL